MSPRRYGNKEYDQMDKLKQENKKLKQEIVKLRKLAEKASNYDHVLELTKKKKQEEKKQEKDEWLCYECGRGYMRVRRIYQANGVFYIRLCDNDICEHRTGKKKYHKNVRGIE